MVNGIYTLANDVVYDQLVALLNSIEVNAGREIPVCVIPYDDRLDKVKAEIETRKNVTLFDKSDAIIFWDNFATQVWKNYPRAQKKWREWEVSELYRLPMHRKLCALEGDFEKFIYFDADTLLMGSIDYIYEKLHDYDWVVNDFQYKSDLKYVFDGSSDLIHQVFSPEKIPSHIFCAGWFGAKKNIFSQAILDDFVDRLQAGEADVMALTGPDQSLFNYMVIKSDIAFYNFAYHQSAQTTGNHWSSRFDEIDNVLYDKGRRLTYLHYMSISASAFTRLCAGEDVDIAYRDVFLHYRYLKSPEQRPQNFKRPSSLSKLQQATTGFIGQKVKNLKVKYRNLKNRISQ
ncbi:sugar transferase [Sphaerospermopsis aphanizomenoides BCCUSP55]|uniref:Npun_R2821/Npun_R2822 family protein n=1 Tax=Sphaerospermopsis aphanizomenoides TaxID=459663 RepID=UPI00190800F9|nr:Npun_R2821/Npun_R2822 family protein [Sphaerospermopsis aphanizomenoides]MBK1987212.1 sugar transferase [Sphaerospermopsis aphanizomenoides BCCUSP55]